MRSLHILFILVVVTWLGFPLRAQEAISIGTRHTLFSHVLNEAREYWVYVPATRPGEKEESYPVLYLLDAEYNVRFTDMAIKLLLFQNLYFIPIETYTAG